MHSSLLPKTNLGLIALWAIASVLLGFFTVPTPWLLLALGAVLGAFAGAFQMAAMRASSDALISTATAVDVRRVLSTSSPGRAYLYALWLSMAALFALAFWFYRDRVLIGWIAGYAAFGLARELMTLRATFQLERLAKDRQP